MTFPVYHSRLVDCTVLLPSRRPSNSQSHHRLFHTAVHPPRQDGMRVCPSGGRLVRKCRRRHTARPPHRVAVHFPADVHRGKMMVRRRRRLPAGARDLIGFANNYDEMSEFICLSNLPELTIFAREGEEQENGDIAAEFNNDR